MELDLHRGGSGEPLVLIHGIGHTWRGWKPMLPRLERSFDVLAPDMPGFGYSPELPPGVPCNPESLANAVEAEMDRAGFDKAHVAGNSLGGWVALELARRGRVTTATCLSPAGLFTDREGTWGLGLLRRMRWLAKNSPAPRALLAWPVTRTLFAGPTLGKPWRADPDDLIEQTRLFANAPGFERTAAATDYHVKGLTTLRVPVLVLWGTRDVVLLPRQGRRFERLIPDCELRYLKGLGHVPMSDDPELLAEAIESHARKARSGAPEQPLERAV
jgi:pimeloyl-ACP methyl ester carboxylesterase